MALETLGKLDPATLSQHAGAVAAMLGDSDATIRAQALETLGKLDPATLSQHAAAVVGMLDDSDEGVRLKALGPLSALPRDITRGIDMDSAEFRQGVEGNEMWFCDDLRSQLLGRLRWHRCRLRWRVQRLALYWYALPYRPSGPGHARDVEEWDRIM